MVRRKRTPEENARREKIRELLQLANVGSMDDIQELFKDTIAEFMENGLEAELGYSRYDYKNKDTDNSRNGHSSKTLRTSFGDVEVSVPRDRKSEFEPRTASFFAVLGRFYRQPVTLFAISHLLPG